MADPGEITMEDLKLLKQQERVLFIRLQLGQEEEIFGRNLLIRGLTILGSMLTPESKRLARQWFRARLYAERLPKQVVNPPKGMVVFPIQDLADHRYVIAIAPLQTEGSIISC